MFPAEPRLLEPAPSATHILTLYWDVFYFWSESADDYCQEVFWTTVQRSVKHSSKHTCTVYIHLWRIRVMNDCWVLLCLLPMATSSRLLNTFRVIFTGLITEAKALSVSVPVSVSVSHTNTLYYERKDLLLLRVTATISITAGINWRPIYFHISIHPPVLIQFHFVHKQLRNWYIAQSRCALLSSHFHIVHFNFDWRSSNYVTRQKNYSYKSLLI